MDGETETLGLTLGEAETDLLGEMETLTLGDTDGLIEGLIDTDALAPMFLIYY